MCSGVNKCHCLGLFLLGDGRMFLLQPSPRTCTSCARRVKGDPSPSSSPLNFQFLCIYSALLAEAGPLVLSHHPIRIFTFVLSNIHLPPLSQVSSVQSAADSPCLQREGKRFPKCGWDAAVPELSQDNLFHSLKCKYRAH